MTRAVRCLEAETREKWSDVWDSFDKRQKAELVRPVANEDAGEADMFARSGVAAE